MSDKETTKEMAYPDERLNSSSIVKLLTEMETVKVTAFPDGRLDAQNAAKYLGKSPKTLDMWRCRGQGPKWIKRGRVFYYLADLDAWLAGNGERSTSTAQARLQVVR